MKKQIRQGVFETNSSSTHSVTMTSGEDYEAWKKGEVMYSIEKGAFLPVKEAIEENISRNFEDEPKEFVDAYREAKDLHDAIEWCEEHEIELGFSEDDIDLYDMYITREEYFQWLECCNYEDYDETYKTKGGETVVAFGYYGNDY